MIEYLKIKILSTYLFLILIIWGCNSSAGNEAGFAGFSEGLMDIDVEQLHNVMTEEMIDSASVMSYLKAADVPKELQDEFLSFYRSRNFRPAWIGEHGANKEAEALLKAIELSPQQGLSSEDYKLQYLYHLKKSLEVKDVEMGDFQKFDQELTTAYFKLANHILRGRINPEKFGILWKTDRRERDLAKHLQIALDKGKVKESLEKLQPAYAAYEGLIDAHKKYTKIATENPDWKPLPENLNLKPGDTSNYVPQLSAMLLALGDAEEAVEDSVFGQDLAVALAAFQERHGLEPDSTLTEATIKMLNIPLEDRIAQIKLNLERLRWLPERPDRRHIVVNIPEYHLHVYNEKDSILSMKVIVGKAYESSTPIFNDTMEHITFSPTWRVPPSIATMEMLPKLRKDPLYLTKKGFKIFESWKEEAKEINPEHIDWEKVKSDDFPYMVVQNPGPNNALGRVKFMFPNKMAIYLHDTPADYLFNREERDFSHGCIRVERPVDLAHYLLQNQQLSKEEIEELMSLPEPKEVPLEERVPVLIEYRTAWMGPDGKVNFREDIYGHDRKQLRPLKKAVAESR